MNTRELVQGHPRVRITNGGIPSRSDVLLDDRPFPAVSVTWEMRYDGAVPLVTLSFYPGSFVIEPPLEVTR